MHKKLMQVPENNGGNIDYIERSWTRTSSASMRRLSARYFAYETTRLHTGGWLLDMDASSLGADSGRVAVGVGMRAV